MSYDSLNSLAVKGYSYFRALLFSVNSAFSVSSVLILSIFSYRVPE
jgi:hypothetical protein